MKSNTRRTLLHWLLVAGFAGSLFCAARGAMLVYSLNSVGGISILQSASAETISAQAAGFQSNTPETDGLFRIVQRQHSELDLMYSSLETASELNWELAIFGTAGFTLLLCLFSVCLAIQARGVGSQNHVV